MKAIWFHTIFICSVACSAQVKPIIEPSGEVVSDFDGDGFPVSEDCDDSDADINPGMSEICDGSDNNCDGEIDEGVLTVFYADLDGDGFGFETQTMESCEAPTGFVSNASDCDDANADIFPGNVESCDGLDNNCDQQIDEGVGETYYLDLDGDGYGGVEEIFSCSTEEDLSTTSDDCDDANNTIYPGAIELCDELDNNCDTNIDEGVQSIYFGDLDGDGYGDENITEQACSVPEGFVENADDCDDSDSLIYPGAVELCDERDNNCEGNIDEEGALGVLLWYLDNDGDGYGDDSQTLWDCAIPTGYTSQGGDCDDSQQDIAPSAAEICDSIDNNCSGYIDDTDPALTGADSWYLDHDGDGYGDAALLQEACAQPSGYVANDSDCDDLDISVFPGAQEICDERDNSCNGLIDDLDPNVDLATTSVWYLDNDGDGYGDPLSQLQQCAQPSGYVDNDSDCDDSDATIVPDLIWYLDYDGDGYGQALYSQTSCTQPYGFVANSDDCDDANAEITPQTEWYLDLDGDGYGANVLIVQCEQPTGYVMNDLDCDDTEEFAWTGATEVCDEVDNDCNGSIDEGVLLSWYLDYDQDGYGDDSSEVEACMAPASIYVQESGDCDDTDNSLSPGLPEGCDNLDRNCDGLIDNDFDGDGYSTADCGGWDCDDSDASVYPELNGSCAMGTSCRDLLDQGLVSVSGVYSIDPDGYGAGVDPFEVYCDMSTDGGGWTQIVYIQKDDSEGYNHLYAAVFSSVESGVMGAGSYKVNGESLLLDASEFRYSEPSVPISDSQTDSWMRDIRCEITTDVLNNIQYPGLQNQPQADVVCHNKNGLSSNAIYMNYQQWSGCWTGPRLWVGSEPGAPTYHGNYCIDCISTWKCDNGTNGVYSGPSDTYYTSAAFWLR